MSYTYVGGKSDRDLISYQSVRGADIKAIASAIMDATPISQLHSDFGRPVDGMLETDSVDNTVQFLQATDFVDRPSDDVVEPVTGQPFDELAFELQICHHLMQQPAPQDHFMEVHRILVEEDTVLMDRAVLLEEVDDELASYPLDWNKQKIKIWYDMMDPFGLVSVQNQKILTSPSPRMVYDLLDEFTKREESSQLREALDWIEEHFFYCYATRGGARPRVHAGLNETIGLLVEDEVLDLKSPSDATYEVTVPSADADQVSSFSLNELPRTPAYEYPLESHELEDYK